jgi:hypothetical protein
MGTNGGKGGLALWALGVASLIPAVAAGGPPAAMPVGEPPAATTPAATPGEPPAATAPAGATGNPPAASAAGEPPAAPAPACGPGSDCGPPGPARYYSPWAYRTPLLYRLSQCIHTWRASPPSGYPTGPWSYQIIKCPVYIFDPKDVPSVPAPPAPGTTPEAGDRAAGEAQPADTMPSALPAPGYAPER